jgi:hypothetical protein
MHFFVFLADICLILLKNIQLVLKMKDFLKSAQK